MLRPLNWTSLNYVPWVVTTPLCLPLVADCLPLPLLLITSTSTGTGKR